MDATPPAAGDNAEFRIGLIIAAAFSTFRERTRHFLALGLILTAVPLFLLAALDDFGSILLYVRTRLNLEVPDFRFVDGVALPVLLVAIGSFLLLAASVTYSTVRHLRGDRPSVVQSILRAFRYILHLIVLLVLVTVAVSALITAYSVLFGRLAQITEFVGPAIVVPGVLGGLALSFWILVLISVSVPALVIERAGIFGCIIRSVRLTGGNRWRVLGAMLFALIGGAISFLAVSALAVATGEWLQPGVYLLVSNALQALALMLVLLLLAVFLTVMYDQLRRSKEGVRIEDVAAVFD